MTDDPIQWTCPFCDRPQICTSKNKDYFFRRLYVNKNKYGDIGVAVAAISCQNLECREITLSLSIANVVQEYSEFVPGNTIQNFKLRPESTSKQQPEYIPDIIRQDYYEACRIIELSPKASATLSRRCLQGMIRDFCGISKATLDQEIKALTAALDAGRAPPGVTIETIEAIDHVRQIGNIGAHMEKDINLIIDIDPNEAKTLIELIEMLFKDWYVAREARAQRLERVKQVAGDKKAQKQLSPPDTTKT